MMILTLNFQSSIYHWSTVCSFKMQECFIPVRFALMIDLYHHTSSFEGTLKNDQRLAWKNQMNYHNQWNWFEIIAWVEKYQNNILINTILVDRWSFAEDELFYHWPLIMNFQANKVEAGKAWRETTSSAYVSLLRISNDLPPSVKSYECFYEDIVTPFSRLFYPLDDEIIWSSCHLYETVEPPEVKWLLYQIIYTNWITNWLLDGHFWWQALFILEKAGFWKDKIQHDEELISLSNKENFVSPQTAVLQ